MAFTLPKALQDTSDEAALDLLQRYYATAPESGGAYTGAHFDTWDSTGSRARDSDRFTPDDVVAVSFLSVFVDPRAARTLLVTEAPLFTSLLEALGPDRTWPTNRSLSALTGQVGR